MNTHGYQTWIQFRVTQNALGRYVIVMTEYSRDASGCTSTSTDIASLDTRYSSKQEAERRLVEIYEGLGMRSSNPESETPETDTKDPLWLMDRDNPDRSYYLLRVEKEWETVTVKIGSCWSGEGSYSWTGEGSTAEKAMRVAVEAAELHYSLKAKYGS